MKYSAAICLLLMGFTRLASADQPVNSYKVYGKMWSYANNWNDPNKAMKTKFLEGSTPTMNVTFNTNTKSIIGYPAHIRGWHYNLNPVPSDTSLPKQVSKLSKIPVHLSYAVGGSNVIGDFAYDIFLRKDASKTTPELEIMIWGDHNSWPIGSKSGTNVLTAGGRTFDLWEGQNSGAGYYVYSFVPHGTVASPGEKKLCTKGSLNVDVKVFFNWLQKNKSKDGKYNDNMYLHCVEVGFEILNGNGWVHFTGSIDVA